MNRILLPFLAFCAVAPSLLAQDSIQRASIERLERTLSADSLEGRGSLTPGNDKAARIIASEFASAGLKPIPGADDFFQKLPVTVVAPGLRKIAVNGLPIGEGDVFVMSNRDSLSSNQLGEFTVAYIAPGMSMRQKIGAINKQEKNTLLLIARDQKKSFDRYKGFFGGRSIDNEPQTGPTVVAVLMDSVPVTSYDIKITNRVETRFLQNIAGMIPGKRANEIVLFSAHYDHLGIITPVDGDSIANGADDDASGTTAVMTLARYFAAKGTPERTLMFVAFAAEEIGGFGSQYFSKQLKPESIVAMCNIEMIGMPSKFGPNSAWMTGFDRSDFGKIVQEASKGSGFSLYPDPYPDQNLFFRSDNATLAKLGVPAHSVSSSQIDTDKYYHSVKDEIETLDLDHMTSVIRGLAAGMAPIISGEKTPTRITDAVRK